MTSSDEESQQEESGPRVILGSGFSRAISPMMPTLAELGELILERLELSPDALVPFGGDLEQWMSFLAVDQPWLGNAENLENRAMFLRVADSVSTLIGECESKVTAGAPPDWLVKLVWYWSERRAQIFTFNYDTLVERSVSTLGYMPWAPMYAASLETRTAPNSGFFAGSSEPSHAYPTLFKLHGSINWMFGGLDAPTDSRIVLTNGWGSWEQLQSQRAEDSTPMYADLVPLVIPPTFTKGPYYGNLSLKAQWRDAARVLADSTDLAILGYSFPPGDLMVRHWLATARARARVSVIDRNPDVAATVARIVGEPPAVTFDGADAIAAYVAGLNIGLLRWRRLRVDGQTEVEITLDGKDQLTPTEHAERPWNSDDDRADIWLGNRLNARWPGAEPILDPLGRSRDPYVEEANMAFLHHD